MQFVELFGSWLAPLKTCTEPISRARNGRGKNECKSAIKTKKQKGGDRMSPPAAPASGLQETGFWQQQVEDCSHSNGGSCKNLNLLMW